MDYEKHMKSERRYNERHLGVCSTEPNPVHLLGDTWAVHRLRHPFPDEPIDQGALAHVGKTDHCYANAAWVHPSPYSTLVHPRPGLKSSLFDLMK